MSEEDYSRAQKLGKKEYQSRMMRGLQINSEVLDDILPPKGSYSEVPLGLVQIPSDQIVGTRTDGRSNAFASNFMPILKAKFRVCPQMGYAKHQPFGGRNQRTY